MCARECGQAGLALVLHVHTYACVRTGAEARPVRARARGCALQLGG